MLIVLPVIRKCHALSSRLALLDSWALNFALAAVVKITSPVILAAIKVLLCATVQYS